MSSKKLSATIFLLIILILATAISAAALQEDFNAFSNKETITACACDLVQDKLYVQNTGDITSTFFIETEGAAAEWSTFAPDTFYLEQGERKELTNYINIPCYARDEYDLTTKVKTLFGYEKSLTQTVDVKNCANVQIIQKSATQETCPCSPITYEFEIMNTGQHTESYRMDVTPYENYITVSDPLLVLEPQQSYTVYAFLNLPCDIHGQQTFSFNALAEGTGILGQLEFNLLIDACYDYRFEAEDEYTVCMNTANTIPIDITNLVDIANKYQLTVDGPLWAHLDNYTVFAWGNQIAVANLIVEPLTEDIWTEDSMTDSFPITINAVTERGQIEETANFTVFVENCYDLNVILQEYEYYGIKGETKEYGVLVENSGTRTSTYLMEAFGPEWATLSSQPEITLEPYQTSEVLVTTTIPEDAKDLQQISVVGTIPEYSIVRSNTFTIEPISLEEAYVIDIQADDKTIGYEGDVILIPITNLGVKASEYAATITAPPWVLAEGTNFYLGPGDNTTIILHAAPTEDVISDRYAIDIEITPADTGLYYTTSFVLGVGHQDFLGWLADNWLPALLIAVPLLLLIALLIVLLILRAKRKREEAFKSDVKEGMLVDLAKVRTDEEPVKEKKRWWVIPLIILLILAIVAGGAFLAMWFVGDSTPAVNETTTDIPGEGIDPMLGIISNEQGLITIDRSLIPGEGNILEVDEPVQLVLDMQVTNPTDKNVIFRLGIENDEESWLTIPEDELYITPHSTADAQLIITPNPDELRNKDYSITVGVSLTGEQIDYDESIDLVIHKKKSFFDTWWFWALIGLLVAIAAVLLITVLKRRDDDHEFKENLRKQDTYYKESRPDQEDRPKRSWWKIILAILVISVILGSVLLAGWYLIGKDRETVDSEELQEEAEEIDEIDETSEMVDEMEQESIVEVDLSGYPGEGNELIINDDETISLDMTVMNPSDERALFTAVTSNDSWITIEYPSIELVAGGSYKTSVTIHPDMDVLKKNDYAISIDTTLEGAETSESYSQNLNFVVKKDRNFFESVWFFIIIGIVVAAIAILVIFGLRKKENKDYDEYFGEEVADEEPEKNPKKAVKKKPRTKLKLDKK